MAGVFTSQTQRGKFWALGSGECDGQIEGPALKTLHVLAGLQMNNRLDSKSVLIFEWKATLPQTPPPPAHKPPKNTYNH